MLARAGARSGRIAESHGATGQAVTGPQDFGPLGRCTDMGAGARRDRFSTIDERGRRCLCEPAHGLRKCRRAMARRGRLVPDLRISAPSVVARIVARARDATDFRPSMNGVGGACSSRRTVCESSREPWRDGAGRLPDLKISAPSVVARILVWASDATDFRPSRNGVGGACASRRTVCESVGGPSRDGAVFSQTSGIRSQSCLHTRRRGRSTGPIFDHRGSGLAAAHGLRECGRAITRRRGLFADVGDSLSSRT